MKGIFLVQQHKKTTVWQWAAGLMLRPRVCLGRWQFYGPRGSHSRKPRRYRTASKEREQLEVAFRNLKPGDRYEIKDSSGKVVAVLGAPAREGESLRTESAGPLRKDWLK